MINTSKIPKRINTTMTGMIRVSNPFQAENWWTSAIAFTIKNTDQTAKIKTKKAEIKSQII